MKSSVLGSLLTTFTCLSLGWSSAAAYEKDTHRRLSVTAYDLSGIASIIKQTYDIGPSKTFRARVLSFAGGPHTAQDWIRFGGSAEDVPPWRVLNHFYDPISGFGLFNFGGVPTPDWGLEDVGELDGQQHSLKDAHEAFYRGLTSSDPERRERELGHTFYSLGHVIHLLQDMAQPQHTRHDMHPPFTPLASLTEHYVEANIDNLTVAGGTVPFISRPRDLWIASHEFGLARFVNANFVSAGTNFVDLRDGATSSRYADPKLDLSHRRIVSGPDACLDGVQAPGELTFFGNAMFDPLSSNFVTNPRMTTHSIFDQRLIAHSKPPIFALNCFNIDASAAILLPKATAYSAALLRHFFRGRLEVRLELRLDGRLTPGLRIVNRTPGETMTGTFELYLDREDETRTRLARWDDLTLAPDDEAGSGVLEIPDSPGAGNLGRYLVVFRGRLGEEPDAVVGAFTAPAFFLVVERQVSNGTLVFDRSYAIPFELSPGLPILLLHGEGREKDPFGPQLPGSSERGTTYALYRDPRAVPGDTAVFTVWGVTCFRRIITGVEFVPFTRLIFEDTHSLAQAALVELEPPERLEQFTAYHMPGPEVVRVLASGLTGPMGEGPTFRVGDVGKLRFIGLRLTTPLPDGGGIGYQVSCGAGVTVHFE